MKELKKIKSFITHIQKEPQHQPTCASVHTALHLLSRNDNKLVMNKPVKISCNKF